MTWAVVARFCAWVGAILRCGVVLGGEVEALQEGALPRVLAVHPGERVREPVLGHDATPIRVRVRVRFAFAVGFQIR